MTPKPTDVAEQIPDRGSDPDRFVLHDEDVEIEEEDQ